MLSSPIVSRSLVASGGDAFRFGNLLSFVSMSFRKGCCGCKVPAFGVSGGNGGGAALGMFSGNGSADGGTALGSFSDDGDFGIEMRY